MEVEHSFKDKEYDLVTNLENSKLVYYSDE